MSKCLIVTVVSLLIAFVGRPTAQATPPAIEPARLDQTSNVARAMVERFAADERALERFDGTPMAPQRTNRMREFYEGWLNALKQLDFDALQQPQKIDFLLLRNHVQRELKALDHAAQRDEEIHSLLPFWQSIVELEQNRKAMKWADGRDAAERLTALRRAVSDAREAVEKGSLTSSRIVANRAAERIDDLRRTLEGWHRFYFGYDPQFTWWVADPYEKADEELKNYADAIRAKLVKRSKDSDEVLGDPIGREALLSELAHEMIPYTPEELIEIAEREFAWCEREMQRAARDLGFGDDGWHKALEHVKNKHVAPGEQPELIRKLAMEAIDFLEERDLVTIPELCRRTWRIEMMSPERQRLNPFFLGGEVIRVSFPTAEMDHDDKLMSMRGNNQHFARATVHHELIPGHHLQGFMAARFAPHRSLFRTPFLVEGWALYWEMVLWDKGLPQSAEDRVGFLFWRSHRCARIIFSLRFHLGQMTAQEAIDFLVQRVGHERSNAEGEVRRSFESTYPPLYQAAYMLGGLQLRALRGELVDAKRMTEKQFHDAVLRENSIPIDMIRASLTKQPLTRDFKTSWRFYDDAGEAEQANDSAPAREAPRASAPPARPRVYRDRVDANWFADGQRFWYRNDLPDGAREFIVVDAEKGTRAPAFDHERLAAALSDASGEKVEAQKLPIDRIEFADENETVRLFARSGDGGAWDLDLREYALTRVKEDAADPSRLAADRTPRPSRRTGPETEIIFVNDTRAAVQLHWSDTNGDRRPYGNIEPGERRAQHTYAGHVWIVTGRDGDILGVFEAAERPSTAVVDGRPTETTRRREGQRRRGRERNIPATSRSPDGKWEAFVRDHNLWLRDLTTNEEHQLTTDGSAEETYGRDVLRDRAVGMNYDRPDAPPTAPEAHWSPDSRRLVAMRTRTAPGRTVYLIESAPRDQLQPKLHSYPYLKPGDEIPVKKPRLFDIESRRQIAVKDELFQNPWDIGRVRWDRDSSRFTFLYNQRGHQALRIIAVDATTGAATALVDEQSDTFIDYSGKLFMDYLEEAGEIVWMSERDGWNHLYLYDAGTGAVKNQITRGEWVVRGVDRVDAEKRQVWFRAGGIRTGQDPYHVHHCRVNFDGTDLVILTEGDGTHTVEFSPDRRYFIDTWSRVDLPPVNELRRAEDGALVCRLEEADAGEVTSSGRPLPERFVAKGRDGVTDIYGIIHRPREFDPSKKYPVIESIYAGPHSAHVPKSFRAAYGQHRLTDEGFIIVQIDGMGTSHRSKAFHDVCWQNLADAGFPDRTRWMKSAAERYPCMDLSRVGIYGGSAGGQNALGALLHHGDFYKAAVADCGCHDNRMDKIWWNEQWMGYPVGPHYAASSNVTHAPKLNGKLLLISGELDRNVDPASTMQVVDALVKADKDFDLLIIPGAGHGAAGTPYGQRRTRDFFMRHLLEKEADAR